MSAVPITVSGDRAMITFNTFDLSGYETFLRLKQLPGPELETTYDYERDAYQVTMPARYAAHFGASINAAVATDLPLAGYLWDYERFIVTRALESKRYAMFVDCGLGKTAMTLEWARHVAARTKRRVLISTITFDVVNQFLDQCRQFYQEEMRMDVLETIRDVANWCSAAGTGIAITNHHKFVDGIIPEIRSLAGFALDESSILKTKGGTIKWNLMKSSYGVQYKLSGTATPAPNDVFEYLSQAGFLDKFNDGTGAGALLAAFFTRGKDQDWRLKPHAKEAFYRFMAGWSIYLRNPASYGFKDNVQQVPAPVFIEHRIPMTEAQVRESQRFFVQTGAGLFGEKKMSATHRGKLSQIAKGFIYENGDTRRIPSAKPRAIAFLIDREVTAGLQTLVWTVFDEEATLISKAIPDIQHAVLSGETSEAERGRIISEFQSGRLPVLISKAQLLGFGMNFQQGGAMIFSGWSDSFEQLYQAVRRMVRYGQTRNVRIHIPIIPELEGLQWDNLQEKQRAYEEQAALQEQYYREAISIGA